jgi:hypothetical protein
MTTQHWFSTSSGHIELHMTLEQAHSGSHSGSCDADIWELSRVHGIARQLAKLDPKTLARELKEWGAWDETELLDHDQNLQRILWLACGDISDSICDSATRA